MLSMMYGEEHRRLQPEGRSAGPGADAARQAVDAAPANHLSHLALAQALFFRKDFVAFRSAAERAIAQNPMDGFTGAYIGHLMAFAGDWDRGLTVHARGSSTRITRRGRYPMLDAYRRGDYRARLSPRSEGRTCRVTGTRSLALARHLRSAR